MEKMLDARAEETEKCLGVQMEKMLDARAEETEKCLSGQIEKMFDTRTEELEKRLGATTERLVDSRMDEMKSLFDTRTNQLKMLIDTRISQSEEFLIDEMERYDRKYEKEFDDVKQRLGTLEGIYRMTKSEADTINLSLKLIENLDKRVTKLEARAAV